VAHTYASFRRLVLAAIAGLVIVCNIWAQGEPVKNWAAPLYWQPSAQESAIMKRGAAERLGTQGMAPEQAGVTATPVPMVFVAVTPCRMMDTRGYDSTFVSGTVYGPPAMTAGSTRTVPVAGVTAGYCSLPATAQAVSVNVTLNDYQGTMYNAANGITMYGINNAAIVPLGTGGAFDIYVTNATNLFIDVNGYYAAIGDTNGNTILGIGALQNSTGADNTAAGNAALQSDTTGYWNTASGSAALQSNTEGWGNTASGYQALWYNTTGTWNTASGAGALTYNTTGGSNTATGSWALANNSTGNYNTADGFSALAGNTTAGYSTATGTWALQNNTSGCCNVANGYESLQSNTTGYYNTADGTDALQFNTAGSRNTASGFYALAGNATGNNNIALGFQAAYYVASTSSNNIHIGTMGASADNGTIRIGGNTALSDPATQTQFFASGIYGATTGASGPLPVVVDSNGQLGTTSSSRAVKQDIEDMGDTTDTLMSLRPVTFRYKLYGPDSPLQYGLVAEEVAEVAPELVARDKDGRIETVFYDKVNAMLLNQVQTLQRLVDAQNEAIRRLESRLVELENRAK
jgi:hypothetical protein